MAVIVGVILVLLVIVGGLNLIFSVVMGDD